METAGNGVGGFGKAPRKQTQRNSKTTPYDRPLAAIRINNNISNTPNPSLLSKLVSPVSRLIYAGADKLFGAFRKRLPAIALPETSAKPRNEFQESRPNVGLKDFVGVSEPITVEGWNLASSSAATDISELENMLKHKTFTRSEIERLIALVDSRTIESGVGEGDKVKLPNSPHILRLEASASGTLNKPEEETKNYNAAISTPVVNSRIFEEDIASPADLAKAFMKRRPGKVLSLPFRSSSQAPRHDSVLLNSTTVLSRTLSTSLAPRTAVTGYPNSLKTPRSRGRSAIYNMPRTPYNRGPSTSSQKVVTSPLLLSSQPAWEHEGTVESSKMMAGNGGGGGGVGKVPRKQTRRIPKTTPYDRPLAGIRINNNASNTHNPSLLSKLVSPASRLIYAGADKLFGAFRKRLSAIAPPETSAEPRNEFQESRPNIFEEDIASPVELAKAFMGRRPAKVSLLPFRSSSQAPRHDSTILPRTPSTSLAPRTAIMGYPNSLTTPRSLGRSAIYNMPRTPYNRGPSTSSQKVVTSPLLLSSQPAWEHEWTVESSKMAVKRMSYVLDDFGSSGPVRRIRQKANLPSYGSSLLKHRSELVSSQKVLSRLEPESKAFKGVEENGETSKRNLGYASVPKESSQMASKIFELAPRTAVTGYPNSLTTPRSRGRSAIYKMARAPYYRGPSTSSQKVVTSPLLLSSQPAWEHERTVESSKMAVKRRSYVLDDFGSSVPVRRIRQKANLPSYGSSRLKHRSELVSSQKVISRLEPESKAFKGVVENGETSKRNLGYGSVPTESSQMASKIFEELERMSPKEKPSGSRLALGNLEKVDSPKFLPSSEDHRKSKSQHRTPEARFQSKDKVEENGVKVAVSRNGHSPINRNSTVPVGGNSLIVSNTDSSLNLTAEPPQKKRAFQMSVHEDFEELNSDNHSNGHVSTPLAEFKKPATSVNANTDEPSFIKKRAFQMSVHEDFEELNTDNHFNGHVSTPLAESKKPATSVNANTDEPSFINKPTGYNFHTSRPSSSNSQPAEYSQSLSIRDTVVLQEATPVCPTVGTSVESVANASPSLLSVMEPSEVKSNISPDAKSLGSTSNFNSRVDKDYWQFSASNNNDNGNTQKSANMLGKAQTLISASPTTASTSGIFSFSHSTNNTSIASSTFTSSSSIPAVGSNLNKMFSSISNNNATL